MQKAYYPILKSANASAVTVDEFYQCMQKMVNGMQSHLHQKQLLIDERQRIGLAVSGGPDSLALCHLARNAFPKARLVAVFVDHNLKELGVSEDQHRLHQIIKDMDIDLITLPMTWPNSVKTSREDSSNTTSAIPSSDDSSKLQNVYEQVMGKGLSRGKLQEALRDRRYALLRAACLSHNLSIMLTAHTMDDDTATMIHRLCSSSGIDGLAGLKPTTSFALRHHTIMDEMIDPLVKKEERVAWNNCKLRGLVHEPLIGHPLLEIPKERLANTCLSQIFAKNDVTAKETTEYPWIVDQSNLDLNYRRNAITNGLVQLQQEKIVPKSASRQVGDLGNVLQLFKMVHRDMMLAVHNAFDQSVIFDSNSGDCTLILNSSVANGKRDWLKCAPVAMCVISHLSQIASASSYPPRTQRIMEMYQQILDALKKSKLRDATIAHQIHYRHASVMSSDHVSSYTPSNDPNPTMRKFSHPSFGDRSAVDPMGCMHQVDLARRLDCHQLTVARSTFLPLSRNDTLKRIFLQKTRFDRELTYGPSFLVQRAPIAGYDTQTTAFKGQQVVMTSGKPFLWDQRVWIAFRNTPYTEHHPSLVVSNETRFLISHMTTADVREFETITRRHGNRELLRHIYSYMGRTPGTHIYQVPVIREMLLEEDGRTWSVSPSYMAFPTLQTECPVDKYKWTAMFASRNNTLFSL